MRPIGPRERQLKEAVFGLPDPPQETVQAVVDDLRAAAQAMAEAADAAMRGDYVALGGLADCEPLTRITSRILVSAVVADSIIRSVRRADAEDN